MIGLIRLALRFLWLAIMVQGIRKMTETIQDGAEVLTTRIESGDESGLVQIIARIHHALHNSGFGPDANGSSDVDGHSETQV